MSRPTNSAESMPSFSIAALLSVGFRPFFLLAALFASVIVPVWIVILQGGDLQLPMAANLWHAHEMIFGFIVAVIAGFLLTAVRNWTGGLPTAHGAALAALALLWLMGRILMLPNVASEMAPIAMLVCSLFLPALTLTIARPLFAAASRRNYKILAILMGLWLAQLLLFADVLGLLSLYRGATDTLQTALSLVVVLSLVVSGRIVPMFTANATGVASIMAWPKAEALAIAGAVSLAVVDVLNVTSTLGDALALVTGLAIFARMRHWGTRHTFKHPLLWVLHLANAWFGLGFLLRGLALVGLTTGAPLAIHAVAFGGVGTLVLGMMSRVTLGHTGRPLQAPRLSSLAFVLFTVGAVVRVLVPIVWPAHYMLWLKLSGLLWTVAFILFLVAHAPMLVQPRPDGRLESPTQKPLRVLP